MNQYLIIFREPDGRTSTHTPETLLQHRQDMKTWMDNMIAGKRISGGNALTLNGKVIKGPRPTIQSGQQTITDGLYTIGTEIVGGYLLLNAGSLEEATAITATCPVLDFGGFAEVRETMPTNPPPSSQPQTITPSDSPLPSHSTNTQTPLQNNSNAQPVLPINANVHSPHSSESLIEKEPLSETENNKRIVRRFNTAFLQDGDTNVFHEIIDPQIINHSAPPGMSKGADGMFDLIQAFKKALPGLHVEITHQTAEGDLVITRKLFHATHTGLIMGIPPSGKKITICIIDVIRLRNGRYAEHWSVRDLSDLIQKTNN